MIDKETREALRGMRVLVLNQSLEMGGAERQALYLARYLKDEVGSEVHFWGSHPSGLVVERCQEWKIECRLVPIFFDSDAATFTIGVGRFVGAARKLKPTIILPYTNPANVMCGLTWRLIGAKACIWNQRDPGQQRYPRAIERLAVRSTPCFVANSHEGAGFLANDLGVARDLVNVVANGVPMSPWATRGRAARREFGIPETTLVAAMVANLHDGKDHGTLIRAWPSVKRATAAAGRDATLLIVGRDGGLESELVSLAADLGLTSTDIRFLGQLRDPTQAFSAADLCVQSTRHEGCSNSVLEAMALGLPVVGTDVPGMRETLADDPPRWLARPEDADGLSQIIVRFLLNDGLRREIGEQNADRARRLYTLEAMCERMAYLIASQVNQADSGRRWRRRS